MCWCLVHDVICLRWAHGLSLPSDPIHMQQRYHSDYSSSSESPSVTSSDLDYRQGKICVCVYMFMELQVQCVYTREIKNVLLCVCLCVYVLG